MIIGLHGILSNGGESTDKLLEALTQRGQATHALDWGHHGPLAAAALRKHNARRLAKLYKGTGKLPHLITHSFSASIALEAMRMGGRFGQVFLFNPAIPPESYFPPESYDHLYVIANSKDRALLWGEMFLEWAGYGDMGRTGYLGKSDRVTTFHGPRPVMKFFPEHGESFSDENVMEWAAFIHRRILDWESE